MRRLLYLCLGLIATLTAIVAQTPDILPDATFDLPTSDSSEISQSDLPTPSPDSVATPSTRQQHPERKRRVNPVNNAATRTQHNNDAQGDTARMLERRRQRSIHYHDENGNTIMVDTVTGVEWVDSTMLPSPPKMVQPVLYAVEVGVNIWDPVMRIFGQKYGGFDISAALNLHNRYIPTFEAGIGMAKNTPSNMNFTYVTPVAPYFKIGADYNFIYNSDPDYRFVAGVRYGFSTFSYRLDNVTFDDSYWGQSGSIAFPRQNVTAGWFEIGIGLRVKIAGPISAGWMMRYHSLLHQTKPATGEAWYIPGFGSSGSALTGSFSFIYTFGLSDKNHSVRPNQPNKHTEHHAHE